MSVTHALIKNGVHFFRVHQAPVIRMACPHCWKGADDNTLWFNTARKRGGCFRCDSRYSSEKEFLNLFKLVDSSIITMEMPESTSAVKRSVCPLPEEIIPAYMHRQARNYLLGRKLSVEDMKRFALLYCPTGFYGNRIVIPIFDRLGEYRMFTSRSILPDEKKKYITSKGGSTSRLLYNLHFIKQTNTVALVEGPFDAMHFFPYSVSLFGKEVSQAQIDLLRRCNITRVYVLLDAEAHQKTPEKYERTIKKLSKYFFTFPVRLPSNTPTEYSVDELKAMCHEARW